jgi:hypothetical protein
MQWMSAIASSFIPIKSSIEAQIKSGYNLPILKLEVKP